MMCTYSNSTVNKEPVESLAVKVQKYFNDVNHYLQVFGSRVSVMTYSLLYK